MERFELDGRSVDAAFEVHVEGMELHVVLAARGGSGSDARNREYRIGMLLALQRIGAIGGEIVDAYVDSAPVRMLPVEARRLRLRRHRYPLRPDTSADLETMVSELMRAQVTVGRTSGVRGGNNTKRVRLVVRMLESVGQFGSSPEWLRSGALDDERLLGEDASRVSDVVFDPTDERDARRRVLRTIDERRGQPAFRSSLLQTYGRRCAFSRYDAEESLEAAHVRPYMGSHTNHVQNGLLLRGDLHTLFDRRLIAIDVDAPQVWRLVLSPTLRDTKYGELQCREVHLPERRTHWPNASAVRIHRSLCGL
jgi:hypothetical protein